MREAKPILGFGPIGWVAAVVLLALSLIAAAGVDVQHAYLSLIASLLGGDYLLRYIVSIHVFHSTYLAAPAFNLFGILYTLIALRIAPIPIAWWKYTIVVLWGCVRPLGWLWYMLLVSPFLGSGFSSLAAEIMRNGLDILTCVVLWGVTGSRLVLVTSLACAALAASLNWAHTLSGSPRGAWTDWYNNMAIGIGWQAAMAGVLLWWAISERRKPREGHCMTCGYDLRGTTHERCPECGASAAQPATAPLSVDGGHGVGVRES